MERIPSLLRSPNNLKSSTGYSKNSPTFGNIPCNYAFHSTGVSPPFLGMPRNTLFRLGGSPQRSAFTLGNTPQTAGSAFGIPESGGNTGFSGSPRSEDLFGGSNTAGTGFSFGGRMPPNQSPRPFFSKVQLTL